MGLWFLLSVSVIGFRQTSDSYTLREILNYRTEIQTLDYVQGQDLRPDSKRSNAKMTTFSVVLSKQHRRHADGSQIVHSPTVASFLIPLLSKVMSP